MARVREEKGASLSKPGTIWDAKTPPWLYWVIVPLVAIGLCVAISPIVAGKSVYKFLELILGYTAFLSAAFAALVGGFGVYASSFGLNEREAGISCFKVGGFFLVIAGLSQAASQLYGIGMKKTAGVLFSIAGMGSLISLIYAVRRKREFRMPPWLVGVSFTFVGVVALVWMGVMVI